MKKREFEALLREAVQLDAEAQGRRMQLETSFVPVPDESRRRFLAALNGGSHAKLSAAPSEPFEAEPETESRTPSPMRERARRILITVLSVGAGAAAAAALLIVVVLPFLRDGSSRKPADAIDTPPTAAASAPPYGELEPTVPADAPDPAELPELPYNPDSLEGEWTSDDGEGGKPSTLVIDRDGTATVTRYPDGDAQTETYRLTERDGETILVSDAQTLSLIRSADGGACLTVGANFACRAYYRVVPDASAAPTLPTGRAIGATDLDGVWELLRAEVPSAAFDLRGLLGTIRFEDGSARYLLRLNGRADANSNPFELFDASLTVRAIDGALTGVIDADSGELKLYAAQGGPVLAFRRVTEPAQETSGWSFAGYWDGFDGTLFAEGWDVSIEVNANKNLTVTALHDGETEQSDFLWWELKDQTVALSTGSALPVVRSFFGTPVRIVLDPTDHTVRMEQATAPFDTVMVFRRRVDETGAVVPPKDQSDPSASELEGEWVAVGGIAFEKGGTLDIHCKRGTFRWTDHVSFPDIGAIWQNPVDYLLHDGRIDLYEFGRPAEMWSVNLDSFHSVPCSEIRYDQASDEIRILHDDVVQFILRREKDLRPTPAPFGETP